MTSPVSIAYLEISGRLSGKTTRLCRLANALAAKGRPVIFVCPAGLVDKLPVEMPDVFIVGDGQEPPAAATKPDAIWFYDEFDGLKSTVVRPGGYYATTAEFLRVLGEPIGDHDVLMHLIKANGNRHERHFHPVEFPEFVQDHRAGLSPEQFRRMILGEFQA